MENELFYAGRVDVISMRELNQNTSEVVRKVAATGRSVMITSNGNPIGVELVPTSRAAGPLDELVARGRASSPAVHSPIPLPPGARLLGRSGFRARGGPRRGALVIYLDSPAVVKLCHRGSATEELVGWLRERSGRPLVSSALVEVEVPRALRRHAEHALPAAPTVLAVLAVLAVLDRLYRIEVDHTVRATAAASADHGLCSLDALQLATAQLLDGVDEEIAFVTYDRRLLQSAARLGFPTASPGQDA